MLDNTRGDAPCSSNRAVNSAATAWSANAAATARAVFPCSLRLSTGPLFTPFRVPALDRSLSLLGIEGNRASSPANLCLFCMPGLTGLSPSSVAAAFRTPAWASATSPA